MKMHLINGVALVILAIISIWVGYRFQVDLEPTIPAVCLGMGALGGICGCLAWNRFDLILEALEGIDENA